MDLAGDVGTARESGLSRRRAPPEARLEKKGSAGAARQDF